MGRAQGGHRLEHLAEKETDPGRLDYLPDVRRQADGGVRGSTLIETAHPGQAP